MKLKVNIALASLAVIALLAPSSAFAALTVDSTSVVSDGALTLNGAVGSNVLFGTTATTGSISTGTALTTGTYTIGGALQTGTLTLGQSTVSQTINIGSGVLQAGTTRIINLGLNDFGSGSSVLNIGGGLALGGTQSINVGTSNQVNTITIGTTVSTVNIGGLSVNINTDSAATFTLGTTSSSGLITLGKSTGSQTISIGSGNTVTGQTQTINIGAGTPAGTGKAVVTIGNTNAASSIVLRAGTGGIDASGSSYFRIPAGATDVVAGDCDAAGEAGKVYIDTDLNSGTFYYCNGTAWVVLTDV